MLRLIPAILLQWQAVGSQVVAYRYWAYVWPIKRRTKIGMLK